METCLHIISSVILFRYILYTVIIFINSAKKYKKFIPLQIHTYIKKRKCAEKPFFSY